MPVSTSAISLATSALCSATALAVATSTPEGHLDVWLQRLPGQFLVDMRAHRPVAALVGVEIPTHEPPICGACAMVMGLPQFGGRQLGADPGSGRRLGRGRGL